jgi:glycerol kinase
MLSGFTWGNDSGCFKRFVIKIRSSNDFTNEGDFKMGKFIGALDQGTTSTRFIVFDHGGQIVGQDQKEHRQIFPQPGWVEHDPMEVWDNTQQVIQGGLAKAGVKSADLAAIGITNQRETTVVWNRHTGKPYGNAVVWQCTRTENICRELVKNGGQNRFRETTGLPIAAYFSGPKIKWLLDHIPEARTRRP